MPRPAKGVHAFVVDDELVVLSEAAQRLYALNTAAAVIWIGVEDGLSRDGLARSLHERSSIPFAQAAAFVADSLRLWDEAGLLAGSERAQAAGPPPGPASGAVEPVFDSPMVLRDARVYAVLGTAFGIACTEPAQEARLHPVLSHLAQPDRLPDMRISIVAEAGRHRIALNDATSASVAIEELAPSVVALLARTAANRRPFLLGIHAGAVAHGEQALLLPAPAGSGKSTLTAALVQSGLTYLCDDLALLEDASLGVLPAPLPISLKQGAWAALRPMFPAIDTLALHHREDGMLIRYLPPPTGQLPASDAGLGVRSIVFPRYKADAPTVLTPLGRAETLRRLLGQCLAVKLPLTRARVAGLIGWLRGVRCHELSLSSLPSAVDLVRAELAAAAPQEAPS